MAIGYEETVLCSNKDSETFIQAIDKVYNLFMSHGHVVKNLRCDAGSTENSEKVLKHCANLKIELHPAAPRRQNQNPIERSVPTKVGVISYDVEKFSSKGVFGIAV